MPQDKVMFDDQIKSLGEFDRHFVRKEISFLPNILRTEEQIHAMTSGLFKDQRNWLVVVTDQRILCLFKGLFFGMKQVELPLMQISGIAHKTGLMFGEIIATTSSGSEVLTMIPKAEVAQVAAALSELVEARQTGEKVLRKIALSNNAEKQSPEKNKLSEQQILKNNRLFFMTLEGAIGAGLVSLGIYGVSHWHFAWGLIGILTGTAFMPFIWKRLFPESYSKKSKGGRFFIGLGILVAVMANVADKNSASEASHESSSSTSPQIESKNKGLSEAEKKSGVNLAQEQLAQNAIVAVKSATLDVDGKGKSYVNVEKGLDYFASSEVKFLGWTADSLGEGKWRVTLKVLNGSQGEQVALWSYDENKKIVKCINKKAKLLSWVPSY